MESGMLTQYTRKRKLVEVSGDISSDEVFKFKILLPNATTLDLSLRNRGPKMAVDEFIKEVRKEYIRDVQNSDSTKEKSRVKWKSGSLVLQDLDGVKIGTALNFKKYEPNKCHTLQIHDEDGERINTFENMWDLTPDTDLLKELPEEYTFETALADLIDNSLQAVWSNDKSNERVIDIDVSDDLVSIFDSGPGMDGSDENSIVKWGKMGASLHRCSKQQAIGGKPPYLKPFFGMFGYGGPIASTHLGSQALVSSKTKDSKKVYFLHLERDSLIRGAGSKLSWKTRGGIRDPKEDEVERAPHGSFTKVEIFEPKRKNLDIVKLQCWLKDIYFPYIQCDELSKTGKTITPVKFQVNGIDLAEVEGGEVATTNLHSSNGPEFVFRVHFSAANSSGSRSHHEANARLRCLYFPICEGKESLESVLEKLQVDEHKSSERFENFSRVSIRRLGRLLPDARWPLLPFMDLRHKKGNIKSQLLKRCCLRVKCFIDIDAGINPTPSKTNLAPQNPFTMALMKLGDSLLDNEKGVDINVYKNDKLLSPVQLEREYNDWILDMHNRFDEEVDRGEDQPVIVLFRDKGKGIGILSDVGRFHEVFKGKKTGKMWKSGHKVKILKGACAGVHKQNVYTTLEYFVFGGFEGDTGGEPKIICRPIDIPEEQGCRLIESNGETMFDLGKSMSLPMSVLDSDKCVRLGTDEWKSLVEKRHQNAPSTIELLSPKQCEELKLDGEELHESVRAGKAPKLVVAVVRPSNYVPESERKNLDQKYIFKSNMEILLEVKFKDKKKDVVDHVYSGRVPPSQVNGIQGIYKFRLGWNSSDFFQKLGVYSFSFSLIDSSCKTLVQNVEIKASSKIGKWKIQGNYQRKLYSVRIGSFSDPLFVECYDIYDNRTHFKSKPRVRVTLEAPNGAVLHVKDFKSDLIIKSALKVEGLLVESSDLDKIRPTYKAKLIISSSDEQFSDSIPCNVTPGSIELVEARPSILCNQLLPGFVIKELDLKMFDAYGNGALKGSEVQIKLEGFQMLYQQELNREVNDKGCVDLSGMLKVTATYGENVSLSILSNGRDIFKEAFQIEKRELRMAPKVPEFLTSGSQLEDIVFQVVNLEGHVDDAINHDEKFGQSHMLTIKADWLEAEESIRYTFTKGRCIVPIISLPQAEGFFSFKACHSRHSCLSLSVEVHLVKPVQIPELDYGKNQTPCSVENQLLLSDPFSLEEVGKKFLISTQKDIKERWDDMCAIGLEIGNLEEQLGLLIEHKEEVEQTMKDLQDSASPCVLALPDHFSSREEVVEEIQKRGHSAASFLCNISRVGSFQDSQNEVVRDVIGVVALLGRVHSVQLSRVLSEYLGTDQMLAVVVRSFKAASALERYRQNGEVDYSHALHAEASKLGTSITGRFLVVCLEDISPFEGVSESDPQQKLCLFNRASPLGFLGFAVNMIDLDEDQLSVQTDSGHGLRETLFYRLFGKLQVYRTRAEMFAVRGCIKHGAVSLDGGILKENGMISLGHGDSEICFQVVTKSENETPGSQETMKELEVIRSELTKTNLALAEATEDHAQKKKMFEAMKDEFDKMVDMVTPILGTQGTSSIV